MLVPSLVLLFGLFLRGTLDAAGPPRREGAEPAAGSPAPSPGLLGPPAVVFLAAGLRLTLFTDHGWPFAIGVACLLAFVAIAFVTNAVRPEARRPRDVRSTGASVCGRVFRR